MAQLPNVANVAEVLEPGRTTWHGRDGTVLEQLANPLAYRKRYVSNGIVV